MLAILWPLFERMLTSSSPQRHLILAHKPLGGQPQMLNWNHFEFMNRRTPMCPGWQNVFNGRASLQMQGMSSGSLTGLLHNTPLQVQLIESSYNWQAAACKWPSDCEWGHGSRVLQRHDKWELSHIGMQVEAEIRHDNNRKKYFWCWAAGAHL